MVNGVRPFRLWVLALSGLISYAAQPADGLAFEKFELSEAADDGRTYSITSKLKVDGQLQTTDGKGKPLALALEVEADFRLRSRRLPSAGRDAQTLRALRRYDEAESKVNVSGQLTSSRLHDDRRTIVAEGDRAGVIPYSPAGLLTRTELDLLNMPGDPLAAIALLPATAVEVGDKWLPESWALQMLTGVEAALKTELECKLATADDKTAKITFQGKIEGATNGATTTIDVAGELVFNRTDGHIQQFQLTQTEVRSVGAVSPGMKVDAKVSFTRAPTTTMTISDTDVAAVPLEPPAKLLRLAFTSPWNVEFSFQRDWHLFHQNQNVAVLRLVERGSLIAQCNISQIPPAKPGQHTPEDQFQADIRVAIGEKFKGITNAEELKSDDPNDRRFLYRVTVIGEAEGVEMHWFYYLCAGESGRQIAFVFAVETKLLDRLAERDLQIVSGLRFEPTPRLSNAK